MRARSHGAPIKAHRAHAKPRGDRSVIIWVLPKLPCRGISHGATKRSAHASPVAGARPRAPGSLRRRVRRCCDAVANGEPEPPSGVALAREKLPAAGELPQPNWRPKRIRNHVQIGSPCRPAPKGCQHRTSADGTSAALRPAATDRTLSALHAPASDDRVSRVSIVVLSPESASTIRSRPRSS